MGKFMMKWIMLLLLGYLVYRNRYRIASGLFGVGAIRHFAATPFGERILDRWLFSESR